MAMKWDLCNPGGRDHKVTLMLIYKWFHDLKENALSHSHLENFSGRFVNAIFKEVRKINDETAAWGLVSVRKMGHAA